LALPTLVAQAMTPIVGEYVLHTYGAFALLSVLLGLSLVNLLITFAIAWRINLRLRLPKRIQRLAHVHTSAGRI
jgi:hypothetical protein